MTRLIDADALLTRIRLNYNNHQNVSASAIKDIIDTQPTAFDSDKVVEELKVKKHRAIIGNLKRALMQMWRQEKILLITRQ